MGLERIFSFVGSEKFPGEDPQTTTGKLHLNNTPFDINFHRPPVDLSPSLVDCSAISSPEWVVGWCILFVHLSTR